MSHAPFARYQLLLVLVLTGCESVWGITDTHALPGRVASAHAGTPADTLAALGGYSLGTGGISRIDPLTLSGNHDGGALVLSSRTSNSVGGVPIAAGIGGASGTTSAATSSQAGANALDSDATDSMGGMPIAASIGGASGTTSAVISSAGSTVELPGSAGGSGSAGAPAVDCPTEDIGTTRSFLGRVDSHSNWITKEAICGTMGRVTSLVWTAPVTGNYTFDASGSDFDARLAVSHSTSCPIADYTCDELGDAIIGPTRLAAGEQLMLAILGQAASQGAFGLSVRNPIKPVTIVNKASGYCLGLIGWDKMQSDCVAEVYDCDAWPRQDQQWLMMAQPNGSVHLQSALKERIVCLTRAVDSRQILIPDTCRDTDPLQEWVITPRAHAFFDIRSQWDRSLCLGRSEPSNLNPGAFVGLSDCAPTTGNSTAELGWLLAEIPNDSNIKLASYVSGLCITATGGKVGDKVQLQPCDGDSPLQTWSWQKLADENRRILLTDSQNRCLFLPSASDVPTLSDCLSATAWTLQTGPGGLVALRAAAVNQQGTVGLAASANAEDGSLLRGDTRLPTDAEPLLNHFWFVM